jgi:hypothetical protein
MYFKGCRLAAEADSLARLTNSVSVSEVILWF